MSHGGFPCRAVRRRRRCRARVSAASACSATGSMRWRATNPTNPLASCWLDPVASCFKYKQAVGGLQVSMPVHNLPPYGFVQHKCMD